MRRFALSLMVSLLPFAAAAAPAPVPVTEERFAEITAPYTACMVIHDARKPDGEAYTRYNAEMAAEPASPCSTFKIPNTLIGLELGVLEGPDFTIPWDGVERALPAWNSDQTLAQAFRNSTVWYYQEVARRIGPQHMREWLDKLDYGNRDTSGGIDRFWLESTLRISADQQVEFLRKLSLGQFPFSPATLDKARPVMLQERRDGVELYGKTGSGGDMNAGRWELGWYVGAVVREPERAGTEAGEGRAPQPVIFAMRITGGEKAWGPEARRLALRVLEEAGYLPPARDPGAPVNPE
jgi:beta-lactamase class D